MELILIGFMGSGKTTVSRLLGEMLNTPVTDGALCRHRP